MRKKFLCFILVFITILLNINSVIAEKQYDKTVLIVLDELDFKQSKQIINENLSVGLLNTKTASSNRNSNDESLFMSIATGRRVSIKGDTFKGIKKEKNSIKVDGYSAIKNKLNKSYPEFSRQMNFLGDILRKQNIKTAYIGNSSDVLMIADKNGSIDNWESETSYDANWLNSKVNSLLKNSDILLISYNISNNDERLDILKQFLENSKENIILFPKNVSGDMNYRLNTMLVPILYTEGNGNSGILTSKSTNRQGVVTNLDIYPTIANYYDINLKSSIGNSIETISTENPLEVNEDTFKEFVNLNLIKYVFHGILTLITIYVVISYRKNNTEKLKVVIGTTLFSIPLSILFGFFHIHTNILLYLILVISISILISLYLNYIGVEVIKISAILTNLLILYGVFFNFNMLYNSFIGYNNIVAGGRFYGLNNEIMGVLIITTVISYFFVRDILNESKLSNIFIIIYIPIIIISLSGRYGTNFGGYLTSIVLFLMMIYKCIFKKKFSKKNSLILILVGMIVLFTNLYLDIKDDTVSHAGKLFLRVNDLGIYEFVDMIIKKLKQLVYMLFIPPWSIIFIAQNYFITKQFKKIKNHRNYKYMIMYTISFVALIINDTGVVAFAYMNAYLIGLMIESKNYIKE